MIGSWQVGIIMSSVRLCLSIRNAVHCGAQSRCRGLKVVPSCSWHATSYSLLKTLWLWLQKRSEKKEPPKLRLQNITKSDVNVKSQLHEW